MWGKSMAYLWTFLYASRPVTGADNGAVVSFSILKSYIQLF